MDQHRGLEVFIFSFALFMALWSLRPAWLRSRNPRALGPSWPTSSNNGPSSDSGYPSGSAGHGCSDGDSGSGGSCGDGGGGGGD